MNEFVFCEKTKAGRINTTQEALLVVVLLSDYFIKDDPSKIPLFFSIFEHGKNSRKFLLLKFILTGIAIQSSPVRQSSSNPLKTKKLKNYLNTIKAISNQFQPFQALNAAGTFLLDPLSKDFRIAADFGRLLINEITFFANNSISKLKILPSKAPLLVNAISLIFAETFKEDILPPPIIGSLLTAFVDEPTPPFILTFAVHQHYEIGSTIMGSFLRWTVLSELFEEKPSYSRLHLKVLESITNIDPMIVVKPIVQIKHLDPTIDLILRAAKTKEPERVQRSVEKFAQLIQAIKTYLYGNIPHFIERMKLLPKNSFLDLVILSVK